MAWTTDIHLNFLKRDALEKFCQKILEPQPDALLISGDIAEAPSINSYLRTLENRLQIPIYFVLGNHDFYRGSISQVRESIIELTSHSRLLHWLPKAGVVEITSETALVGHDTWADGRFGDYENSPVLLNDYVLIEELSWLEKNERLMKIQSLAEEAAAYLRTVLPNALEKYRRVIVLVHVPPFKESCWHEGRISDDNWLPHFSCKSVGDLLLEMMQQHTDREMLVLCGHTHGQGETQMLPNLLVKTGGAIYGKPAVQDLLLIE
ncbi:MAG: metallophosphoesterase [Acidobacteriota bacterium]